MAQPDARAATGAEGRRGPADDQGPAEEQLRRERERALEDEAAWRGDDRDPAWVAARPHVDAMREAVRPLLAAHDAPEVRAAEFDDTDLVRFLVARENDPHKAAALMVEALEWRARVRPDAIPEALHEVELRQSKAYVDGTDVHGHPVVWYNPARHVASECTDQTREAHGAFLLHTAVGRLRPDENVHQFVVVEDLTDFGYANMDNSAAKIFVDMLNKGMAERLHRAYLRNAGWLFWVFWKVVSVFFPKRTRDKLVFCRSDAEWQAVLDSQFDRRAVPRAFGGEDDFVYEYVPGAQVCVRGDPKAVAAARAAAAHRQAGEGHS